MVSLSANVVGNSDKQSAGLSQADLATPIADVSRSVFANNEVAMADINVVGFDYDYTLANYTGRLPKLIYQLAQSTAQVVGPPHALTRVQTTW